MKSTRAVMLAGDTATPVLERQLDVLESCDVRDVTLVAGGDRHRLGSALLARVRFVHNRFHGRADSLFALWLARHVLRYGALIVNGAAAGESQLLRRLLDAPVSDAVLVEDDDPGYDVRLAKVGAEGGRWLVRHVEALLAGGADDADASLAFQSLAKRWPLRRVNVNHSSH